MGQYEKEGQDQDWNESVLLPTMWKIWDNLANKYIFTETHTHAENKIATFWRTMVV